MHYVYTNQKPLSRIPDSQIRQKLIRKPQHPSKSLNISQHPNNLDFEFRISQFRIHVRPFTFGYYIIIYFFIGQYQILYSGETKYSNCSSSRSFKIMRLRESLPADCS